MVKSTTVAASVVAALFQVTFYLDEWLLPSARKRSTKELPFEHDNEHKQYVLDLEVGPFSQMIELQSGELARPL